MNDMPGPKHISGKYRPREIQKEIEALGPGESATLKRSEFPRIRDHTTSRYDEPSVEESVVRLLWRIPESTKNISFNNDRERGEITFTRRESPAPEGTVTFIVPKPWKDEYRIRPDGLYEIDYDDDY